MARLRHSSKTCPACTLTLVRTRRTVAERQLTDPATGWPVGRYRCANLACGWQGLLPRQSSRQRQQASRRTRPGLLQQLVAFHVPLAQAGSVLLVAALLVLVGVQGARLLLGAQPVQISTSVPLGESHDGDPLPARHPWVRPVAWSPSDVQTQAQPSVQMSPQVSLQAGVTPAEEAGAAQDLVAVPPKVLPAAVEPLEMRRGCAWGQPGRNPYRGTVEQALLHARLPAEVVAEVSRKVHAREVTDRLEIRTGRIHGVNKGQEFDPQRVALSFGRSLCLNSRVNFAPGHVEGADLYETKDKRGHLHSVMVPDVCGNVSVLGVRGERRRALHAAGGGDDAWWVLATAAAMSDGHSVAEPGTLAGALLALAALAGVSARRRRG